MADSANITRRNTFKAALVLAVATPATVGIVSMAIPDMFREWLVLRDRDYANMASEQAAADYEQYAALQALIIAAEPETTRDVAIQAFVDSDGLKSEFSEAFLQRMQRIAFS